MQHYGTASIYHLSLEEQLVNSAVLVDDLHFGSGKVQAPVRLVRVYDLHSMELEGSVETRNFENFA